ncbi:MAG: hypothetical protein JWR75_1531 [Devosia sp.]|nr:hypothetical protein [Devosia sp.]
MARATGVLTDWNDDRGFGFIVVDGTTERLFMHIKAVRQTYTRPRIGDRLSFTKGPGRGGKLAALDVDIALANPRQEGKWRRGEPELPFASDSRRVIVAAGLLVLLFGAIVLNRLPLLAVVPYAVMGGISAIAYWWDKGRAEAGAWRTPEARLHGLDFAFGIIGGLLAQHSFRHKTRKPEFVRQTWWIAALHGLGLAVIALGGIDLVVALLADAGLRLPG